MKAKALWRSASTRLAARIAPEAAAEVPRTQPPPPRRPRFHSEWTPSQGIPQ